MVSVVGRCLLLVEGYIGFSQKKIVLVRTVACFWYATKLTQLIGVVLGGKVLFEKLPRKVKSTLIINCSRQCNEHRVTCEQLCHPLVRVFGT